MSLSQMSRFQIVKAHKRLWIECDGEKVYTPPSFIRLPSREPLMNLARRMSDLGRRDIAAIAEFEARYNPRLTPRRLC